MFSSEKEIQKTPISITGLFPTLRDKTFVSIAAGYDHVIALTSRGLVYTWGRGDIQQLGRVLNDRRLHEGLTPEPLRIRNIKYIASGHFHSFAIDKNDMVYSWGNNEHQQTGIAQR